MFKPLLIALTFATPAAAQDMLSIMSPSGNILCGMYEYDPGVRCDIFEVTKRSFTRAPAGCEFDWGQSFWIGAGAAKGELACVSDIAADPSQALTLDYGKSVTFAGVTCRSEKTGMTCVNASGHGFTVSKAKQTLF